MWPVTQVMSMWGYWGVLDGFKIRGGRYAGVYCNGSSVFIEHNKITANGTGVYCEDIGESAIRNNWVYHNLYGLYFDNPLDPVMVRNNTVANNEKRGIELADGFIEPVISNCIFWGHPDANDLVGCTATYSCIEDGDEGQGNISPTDPCFAEGTDNYLLKSVSACIDAGDPNGSYGSERDIDKHFRVLDGGVNGKIVDMGADEYCNEGDENDADFNNDGIVDTNDLRELATAWLIDANDPDWDDNYSKYDLNTDDVINYGDFAYFAKEWLWIACWKMADIPMMEPMMGAGGGMGSMSGAESMSMSEDSTQQQASETEAQPESGPSVAEQIEQIKELLDWLYEVADTMDEEIWLNLVTSLEEMLKDLQQ